MTKQRIIKGTCFFLSVCLCLLISICYRPEISAQNIEKKTIDLQHLPEAIDTKLVNENGHVVRLTDKETDLNSIVFENENGTESIYIFDEPVKYINQVGEICDKSNKLYPALVSGYSYVNKENDIQTLFPSFLNSETAIELKYKTYSIITYPFAEDSSVDYYSRAEIKDEYVYYDHTFGTNTSLRYKTTFSGFKEDIVLYEPDKNSFSFVIKCSELIPKEENGNIFFVDKKNRDIVAQIDPILVKDSYSDTTADCVHETWNNTVSLTKNSENNYLITITVDEDFIHQDNIVYPIYIDPSVTITSTGSGSSKTIVDTPIYNGSGVTGVSMGSNPSAVVGYVGTVGGLQYGRGRLLMKFPGLMSKSFMSNQNYHIDTANLYLTEASGNTTSALVSAYIYTGPNWSESSVYSSDIWNGIYRINGVEQTLSSFSYSYPNSTNGNFDITDAVRLWQSNNSYGNKGIILKNHTNETNLTYYKSLYTSEGTSKPYLYVSYSNRTVASNAFIGNGTPSKTFSLKLSGSMTLDSTWQSLITSSCNSWNNTHATTNITPITSGSSSYTIIVSEYPSSIQWYGRTSFTSTTATIEINASKLPSSSSFRRSTITHEIGHLLWLNDNPNITDYSLMDHSRDRYRIYNPQMTDIFHVIVKYG